MNFDFLLQTTKYSSYKTSFIYFFDAVCFSNTFLALLWFRAASRYMRLFTRIVFDQDSRLISAWVEEEDVGLWKLSCSSRVVEYAFCASLKTFSRISSWFSHRLSIVAKPKFCSKLTKFKSDLSFDLETRQRKTFYVITFEGRTQMTAGSAVNASLWRHLVVIWLSLSW